MITFKFYSISDREYLVFSNWVEYQDRLNYEMKNSQNIDFSDYKNHESLSVLPSYHPYWKFKVYLNTKQIYISKLRTIESYQKIIAGDDLNVDTKQQIVGVMEQEISASKKFRELYQERGKQFIKNNMIDKITIDKIKNGEEFFIKDGKELGDFKVSLDRNNESALMGYDSTYDNDPEVSSGFVKYLKPKKMFYLSKDKN